jgi:hypothetical protein
LVLQRQTSLKLATRLEYARGDDGLDIGVLCNADVTLRSSCLCRGVVNMDRWISLTCTPGLLLRTLWIVSEIRPSYLSYSTVTLVVGGHPGFTCLLRLSGTKLAVDIHSLDHYKNYNLQVSQKSRRTNQCSLFNYP